MKNCIDRKIEDKIVDCYAMAILLPKEEFYQMLMDNKYFESPLEEKRRIIKEIAAKKQIHEWIVEERIGHIKILYDIKEVQG